MALTFGHKLKGLRGGKVVSQRELAGRLDMDPAYLSRIENDLPNHLPSVDTIERIVKALRLQRMEADQLFVLAGRIPPDVRAKLLNNPRLFDFIRRRAS